MANTSFDAQLQAFRKKFNTAADSRKKQIDALRAKAAEAALSWVMAHEARVNQFKGAVKGTPVAAAVDKLIDMLKSEAKPARKATTTKARTAAKKTSRTSASRKAPKRAARKAASKKTRS